MNATTETIFAQINAELAMATTHNASHYLIGSDVAFVVNAEDTLIGRCVYVTADGWVGIQASGVIDEAPITHVIAI